MKKFPILYKYTSKGQVQQWQIIVNDDSYYTIEGIKDGKLTQSLPTYCIGKNIGKKNETSAVQQAEKEAAAKYKKKVDSGYNEVITYEKNFIEPMLAENFEDRKSLLFTRRTFVQPKMDGIRAINADNSITSRNGKKIKTCPHLYQDKVVLDGELYNHAFRDNFGAITSLCGANKKGTKEDIEDAERMVEFWAYDLPSEKGVFSERYKLLVSFIRSQGNTKYKLVPTYEVFSMEDILKYHEQFLEMGFEGTIIRLDLGDYEYKRSKQLIKYKDFTDTEFVIKGYEEGQGNRAGTIGKFIMDYPEGQGSKEFKSNVKGDFKFLKEVWKNRESFIGKTATVKHFGLTPLKEDGTGAVPRFPYVTKIARENYE